MVWDGVERRSPERRRAESDRPAERSIRDVSIMRDGIHSRVRNILHTLPSTDGPRDNGLFSPSAVETLAPNAGNIMINRGVLESIPATSIEGAAAHPHGVALVAEQPDGSYEAAQNARERMVRVFRSPIKVFPEQPADPQEIQARAAKGELPFEYVPTQTMAVAANYKDTGWDDITYVPAGEIALGPLADRYGQTIFGGSRAVKMPDGQIALFRPDAHAKRFCDNAHRLRMAEMDPASVIEMYKRVTAANAAYVPPAQCGSLYLAPGMRAAKNQLGVQPNLKYLLTCLASPVGRIYQKPLSIMVERKFHRAARGGVGDVKAAGNYAPTFALKEFAATRDHKDVLFLSEESAENIKKAEVRELSSSNVFFVTADNVLITPNLSGEILPGITRDSILIIAPQLIEEGIIKGIEERRVFAKELHNTKEAFSSGTGVSVMGWGNIEIEGRSIPFETGSDCMGPVARAICQKFAEIQSGKYMNDPDSPYKDWMVVV